MKKEVEEIAFKARGVLKTRVDEALSDWRRYSGVTTILDADVSQERLGGIWNRISLMFKGKGLYDLNENDAVNWTWSAMDLPMTHPDLAE